MKSVNKWVILSNILWYSIWLVYIAFFAKEESFYFFMVEFASVTSFMVIISLGKEKIGRKVLILSCLILVFGPIFLIFTTIFAGIYFIIAELFRIIQFKFLDGENKVYELEKNLKNLILLVLSGIIGLGVLSIFIYFIVKVIDEAFELAGSNFRMIKLGNK